MVADDGIVKVHVHTNPPGHAIERALTYGQLSRMKIDNMRLEHQEKVIKDAEKLARERLRRRKNLGKTMDLFPYLWVEDWGRFSVSWVWII